MDILSELYINCMTDTERWSWFPEELFEFCLDLLTPVQPHRT